MIHGEPRDFVDFIFMRRAAGRIGRRMHGEAWTGEEFEAAVTDRIFDIPHSEGRESRARALLGVHRPDRILPSRPRPPPPISPLGSPREVRLSKIDPTELAQAQPRRRPPEGHLSYDDLQAADQVAREINERAVPAIERRKVLFDRLVTDAEAGRLTVTLFNERNGNLHDMPRAWWRSQYAHRWFATFQMEPKRPFDMPTRSYAGVTASGFQWLYAGSEQLARYLVSIAAEERPDWWPGERETTAPWCHRPDVQAELHRRLDGEANPTVRRIAQILEEMAHEGGKTWKWESIEVTYGRTK